MSINTISINKSSINTRSIKNKLVLSAAVCILGSAVMGVSTPARAGGAGAFLGGVLATKVMENMNRRTDAEEVQPANSVPAYSAPAQKSPEESIRELDKLKAGGYISAEEYKQKKQAILNNM